jgi:biotin carboxylase
MILQSSYPYHYPHTYTLSFILLQAIEKLKALPLPIVAVIAGAETGVELADQLSHGMGLRSNGLRLSEARRNKYHMGEAVRRAGVRAVLQRACTNVKDVEDFIKTLPQDNLRFVVKPVASAGTEDVFLCSAAAEGVEAFNTIIGKRNALGILNKSVLVQEFLQGKEYAIDKVSRDGVHKIVAIWEYDKRPINGCAFVYHGKRVMSTELTRCQEMIEYGNKVLDALDIRHGPSHMEIIYNEKTGPCLVEVGARCHGCDGNFIPIVEACIGYSQVSVTLDAYLDGKLFNSIDGKHYPMMKAGCELDFISTQCGVIRSYPCEQYIRNLPSFSRLWFDKHPGDWIPKTINLFNYPGSVQLIHESLDQMNADFESIHALNNCGLIDFSVICTTPPATGFVVVVDPFSSGTNLAAMAIKWGFKPILVFSENETPGEASILVSDVIENKGCLLFVFFNIAGD